MPLSYLHSHFSIWPILLPFWSAPLTWFKPSSCLWLCSASCYCVHSLGDSKKIWKNVIGMTTCPWFAVVVDDICKQVQSPLYRFHFSLVLFMSKETTDGTFASFTITSLFPFLFCLTASLSLSLYHCDFNCDLCNLIESFLFFSLCNLHWLHFWII